MSNVLSTVPWQLRALLDAFRDRRWPWYASVRDRCGRAGPPPPPPPPPPMVTGADVSTKPLEVGTGLILGRVVEAGTNTPVPDAMVTLTGASLGVGGQRFTNGVAGGQRLTVADTTGRFLFRDLPRRQLSDHRRCAGLFVRRLSAGQTESGATVARSRLDRWSSPPGEKRGDVDDQPVAPRRHYRHRRRRSR